jgi:hypothetical protein
MFLSNSPQQVPSQSHLAKNRNDDWTKAEASKKIEELQQKTERGKRRTASANGIANS